MVTLCGDGWHDFFRGEGGGSVTRAVHLSDTRVIPRGRYVNYSYFNVLFMAEPC